jgi:imidazolonepropionase-like amidohydrolase
LRAGIPAAEVLRTATLTSAMVMGANDRGVIAAGKLADMILVEGDAGMNLHVGFDSFPV